MIRFWPFDDVKATHNVLATLDGSAVLVGDLVESSGKVRPSFLPPQNGFLLLDRAKFPAAFAGDLKPLEAEFMADSQVPWGMNTPGEKVTNPAWKTHKTYYLVSTDDHMIPPRVQRMMATRAKATVVESPGSHAVYVSHPKVVADLIERAAKGS